MFTRIVEVTTKPGKNGKSLEHHQRQSTADSEETERIRG